MTKPSLKEDIRRNKLPSSDVSSPVLGGYKIRKVPPQPERQRNR